MSKNLLGAIITVIAFASIAGIVLANNKSDEPAKTSHSPSDMSQDVNMSSSQSGENVNNSTAAASEVQIGTVEMDIKEFAFSKSALKIKKGTKVVWTNQDSVRHDVAPDNESEAFKASGLLAMGQSYEFTFNTAGSYAYHCSPHPSMKATVEVVE